MTTPRTLHVTALILVLSTASTAWGQSVGSASGASSQAGSGQAGGSSAAPTAHVSAAVSSGWSRYYPFYVTTVSPSGQLYTYLPPPYGGLRFSPPIVIPASMPRPKFDPGTVAPLPPPGLIREARPARPRAHARKGDPAARRACSRWATACSGSTTGNGLRIAISRRPGSIRARQRRGWGSLRSRSSANVTVRPPIGFARPRPLSRAGSPLRDVEAIYAEPADFTKQLAKLQSHLHAHPADRDAWLVLGAQWFLSGREGPAADVFRRLDDPHRRPDAILAAFLDATNQPRADEPLDGGDPFKPPCDDP